MSPFKMNFNKDDLSGFPPAPDGWYTLQFKTFRPKIDKSKEGLNFNAEFAIVGNQEYEGRKVFAPMSTKAPSVIYAIVHGTGLDMETIIDGNEGTKAENKAIPGTFEHVDQFPDDPSQWGKYVGPLTNKTLEAELAIDEYQGQQKNVIRQVRCALAGCTDKHPTNMIWKKAPE